MMKFKSNRKIFFVVLAVLLLLATWAIPTLAESSVTGTIIDNQTSSAILGESSLSTFSSFYITDAQKKENISKVEAGLLDTAYASWWQKSSDIDDSNALQSAINSKAKSIIVEDLGRSWIVNPLFVKGLTGKTIILQKMLFLRQKREAIPAKLIAFFLL